MAARCANVHKYHKYQCYKTANYVLPKLVVASGLCKVAFDKAACETKFKNCRAIHKKYDYRWAGGVRNCYEMVAGELGKRMIPLAEIFDDQKRLTQVDRFVNACKDALGKSGMNGKEKARLQKYCDVNAAALRVAKLAKHAPDKFEWWTKQIKNKNFGSTASSIKKYVGQLKTSHADCVKVGATDSAKTIGTILAKAEKMGAEVVAMELAALKALKCPKGKKRNRGLEKKLRQAWTANRKAKVSGKFKLHQVRTNKAIYKETHSNGEKEETVDTYVCFEKLDAKQEPRCHYDRMSFYRKKPRRGRWSKWKVGGIGENSRMFCTMVNK